MKKADRRELLSVRRAWRGILLGCATSLLILAPAAGSTPTPPHVAIHAPERTFSAADVRARLARGDSPTDRVLREMLQNPEQLKTLLTLMDRVRQLAGDDLRWPNSPSLNERLSDLAERLSLDEKLLAALKDDPEVAQIAARLAQSAPAGLRKRLRDQAAMRGTTSGPLEESKAPAAPKSSPGNIRPNSKPRTDPDASTGSARESAPKSEPRKSREPATNAPPTRPGTVPQPNQPSAEPIPDPTAETESIPAPKSSAPKTAPLEEFRPTPMPAVRSGRAPRDPLTANLIRASRNLENVGGPLKDSAALKRAIQRLETSTPPPPPTPLPRSNSTFSATDGKGGSIVTSGLEKLTGGTEALSDTARGVARSLRQQQVEIARMTSDARARIRSALPRLPKPPPLPRPRLEDLGLSWPSVPKFTASLSAFPAFSAREILTWIAASVALLVTAIVLAFVLRMGLERRTALAHSGPPIPDPATIKDRPSLCHGVEQLALAVLGESARADHHLRLAERLFDHSSSAGPSLGDTAAAARELAGVYERARYLPPETALAYEEIERGKRRCIELAMKYRN